MNTITDAPHAPPKQAITRVAVLTTVAALVTNLSLFAGARAADISFVLHQPGSGPGTETVSAGAVVAATVVTMTVGWVLVGLAARRHQPALGTMAILGGIVAVISALAPLALQADLSVRLTLASLHLVTGVFFVTATTAAGRASVRAIR